MKKWGLILLCVGILCLSACGREGDGGQPGEKGAHSGDEVGQAAAQAAH